MTAAAGLFPAPGGRARALRELLAGGGLLLAPGAADALTARLIERAGFPVCYFTGAGFANGQFALPDVGLVSFAEVVEQARRVASATALPVIVDADAGYGNAIAVMRTVRELEGAGAAGLQIEDQVAPKRCGHFEGKAVVATGEMVGKIHAAVDARIDPDFVIVARTDARAVEGLEAALARARRYREAGADLLFVEAPHSLEELEAIPRAIDGPCLVNVVPGGVTPTPPAATLAGFGFRMAIYPNVALLAAARAARDVLAALRTTGDVAAVADRLLGWTERQALVGLPAVQALERKYLDRS